MSCRGCARRVWAPPKSAAAAPAVQGAAGRAAAFWVVPKRGEAEPARPPVGHRWPDAPMCGAARVRLPLVGRDVRLAALCTGTPRQPQAAAAPAAPSCSQPPPRLFLCNASCMPESFAVLNTQRLLLQYRSCQCKPVQAELGKHLGNERGRRRRRRDAKSRGNPDGGGAGVGCKFRARRRCCRGHGSSRPSGTCTEVHSLRCSGPKKS